MELTEDIQAAIKSGRALIGYRETMKLLKSGDAKSIVVSNNIPENVKKEIEHNAKLSGTKLEIFEGSSKDLGVVCGKPFSVTALAIK